MTPAFYKFSITWSPFECAILKQFYTSLLRENDVDIQVFVQSKFPTFQDGMELEIQRLKLGLSAAQRDHALISIARDPASIDPNKLLDDSYLFQVHMKSFNLKGMLFLLVGTRCS